LKQAIINRIEDKEKFINICDINDLVSCIKESKMSLENELDDLKQIKKEIRVLNKESKLDADKLDKKMNYITNKLTKQSVFLKE
jgi:hypothetical protein